MTTTQLHQHLQELVAERATAMIEGLGTCSAYLQDIDGEIAATREAYVGAAVTEIAMLRGELHGRGQG